MSNKLKRVLITGGSRGIGLASAKRFAADGAELLINYHRDDEQAANAQRELEALGATTHTFAADLGDDSAIDGMFERIGEKHIDALIVNAAATAFKPLLETKPHNINKTLGITVSGFIHLAQRAVSLMPNGACIVAVSGFDAIRVIERHATLGAAKAAMETLVKYMAVEFAPLGIRVNGVSPGYIDTKSAQIYAGVDRYAEQKALWEADTPLGRLGKPEEVAALVYFLASNDASFITGQTVVIDGGLTLR